MFSGVLRLDSELLKLRIVGVLGVDDGELGTDGPRWSGCKAEPGKDKKISGPTLALTSMFDYLVLRG